MDITSIKGEMRDILERIGGMCSKSESGLSQCRDGFIKNKINFIDEAGKVSPVIRREGIELRTLLSKKAVEPGVNKELIKSLMSIVSSIEMAVTGLESTIHHVRVKISEKLLFSDKAVDEVGYIFKETIDILKTASDAFLTRNEVLMKHAVDKYKNLNEVVDSYAEGHEDRLIKGVCQPQASPVYLNIMDAIMTVVWHTKQALMRFFECR